MKNFNMFIPCGNIDGTDQPAHPSSLMNIFVVHYEGSFVLIHAKCKVFIMILLQPLHPYESKYDADQPVHSHITKTSLYN